MNTKGDFKTLLFRTSPSFFCLETYFQEGSDKFIDFAPHIFYRGRHSIVRRVMDKVTGNEYAAKIIPVANEKQRLFFMHELANLRSLDHKGIPRVVDLFQTERQLVIVMELYPPPVSDQI